MWSDPIDELLSWAERLLESDENLDSIRKEGGAHDRAIFARTVAGAMNQRELERRTRKVGFEAFDQG